MIEAQNRLYEVETADLTSKPTLQVANMRYQSNRVAILPMAKIHLVKSSNAKKHKAHSVCFSEGVPVVTESDGQHLVARSDFRGLWERSQEK